MTFFGRKIADVRKDTEGAQPPSYSPSPLSNFVGFIPLTVDNVRKLIADAPSKQSDLDPWPTWLMKDCANDVSSYITRLTNISMASGCVPPTLKAAYITPIIKKPQLDMTDVSNYRPISNLWVVSKLLERAICLHLVAYLDEQT